MSCEHSGKARQIICVECDYEELSAYRTQNVLLQEENRRLRDGINDIIRYIKIYGNLNADPERTIMNKLTALNTQGEGKPKGEIK